MKQTNITRALRRKKRVRFLIKGSEARPRISVFRSNKYMYAQAIDDVNMKTVAAISTLKSKSEGKKPVEVAFALGKDFAEKLKAVNVTTAVLDRGPYAYKGNVKAFTEGVREGGVTI